MLDEQGGKCAICLRPQEGKPLSIDHNHASGQVRALLCSNCNSAIGRFGESTEILERAAQYLERVDGVDHRKS